MGRRRGAEPGHCGLAEEASDKLETTKAVGRDVSLRCV